MRNWLIIAAALLVPALGLAGPVDLNSADAATLARELDGIGLARAKAIVEYREKNGKFRSADELLKVKGIGPQVLQQNKANLQLRDPAR
ncbi:MAG: helix-hairpin-helix domain-containing protein [Gammaproteobacteria bacterium]|nr:MAG: helix-hairpin-helix domain-containing protein [Gammaproteobacteria bacterium]